MPLWTDIVIAVAAAFTVAILLAAAFLAWHEVRCIERAREAQLLTDLSRRWDEELLRESRETAEKYTNGRQLRQALGNLKKNNDKEYYILLRLPSFFEDLGLLVSSQCFSRQLANDLFGTAIKYHYNRYELAIKYLRKKYKDENIYKFFTDLATDVSS